MNLENDLRDALARTPAPNGFADRVLSALGDTNASPRRHWSTASTLRRIAAVVVLTAALGGLTAHQINEHRRTEGDRARRQLMTALHIASAKMRVAQRAVAHD
jgi:hypothetical protein